MTECASCGGSGERDGESCLACHGSGQIPPEQTTITETTKEQQMKTDQEVVVKIVGITDPSTPNPIAQLLHQEHAGRWIISYDHHSPPGERPHLVTTAERTEAHRYRDLAEWHQIYSAAYGIRPWDGKPNRPITAFNIEVTNAEGGT